MRIKERAAIFVHQDEPQRRQQGWKTAVSYQIKPWTWDHGFYLYALLIHKELKQERKLSQSR